MKRMSDIPVEILAGASPERIVSRPLPPYSPSVVAFLAALSKALLARRELRPYPDIAAFAFWCRKANLRQLAGAFGAAGQRLGRGLVLHIAPSNVPVNFAFSFAFGLLAGNANIVRVPGASHPQVAMICEEIERLFSLPEHANIAAMNALIRYPRNDEVTAALSRASHVRVLWGGDETIAHLRAIPTQARCVDVAFADRYSLCVMAAEAVLAASETQLAGLTEGFYNDVFFLDQNACSSPHLILWQGSQEQAEAAMLRFWPAMRRLLASKGRMPALHAVEKFTHLCRTAIRLDAAASSSRHANDIYRVRLAELPEDIDMHRGRYGFFFEYVCADLNCLKRIVGERYQTLSCFGVDRQQLIQFVVAEGLIGIDRVVPVGKALDIGVIWDGYDLVGTLSRVISDR